MERTFLLMGDHHIGSSVSICPPVVDLDDGGTYHASRGQRWLWDCWQDVIDRAGKVRPVLILNGDLAEGDAKARSTQVVTRNKTTVLRMAADVFDPLAKTCAGVYATRGTPAHVGKSSNLDEAIAEDLDAAQTPEKTYSWWELPLQYGRFRMAVAHHVTAGGMPWTRKSAAQKLAARIVFNAAERGEVAPDLVVRGHVHQWFDSYDAHRTRVVILPAWTLATEYIHRIEPGALAEIGAALVRTDGKTFEVEKWDYKPRGRQWHVLR